MTNVCYVFKGAGGYIAWYLGYAKYMQYHTDLTNAMFGGTSAGSIIATFLAAGIPIQDVWTKWFQPVAEELPATFRFPSNDFVPIAKKYVSAVLTPSHFNQIKGRINISLTDLNLNRVSINKFQSVDDLVECAMASCHVPWVIDGTATTSYGGSRFMDGSLYSTITRGTDPYMPCGEKIRHVQIQTPYKSYEQIGALRHFKNMEFHYKNYIDGYQFAQRQHENKRSIQHYAIGPQSPHFDQSTVSL